MGTNARKIEHFPTSRQLWELKYTVFQCKEDGSLLAAMVSLHTNFGLVCVR